MFNKRIKQKCVENAVSAWRSDAIEKLKIIGVRYCKLPKNKTLIKDCYDNNIDLLPIPKIEDFYSKNKEENIYVKEHDFVNFHESIKEPLKVSRKIKSTLPCPTKEYHNGIVDKYKQTKSKKLIKPTGYKQNSKKSEIIDIENFYETWAWKDIRYQAIKKHGRRCMNCGQSPSKDNKVVIHVDHIKPVRKYPELALSIDNLQILCEDCNQGKGFWDETDFREDQKKTLIVSEETLSSLHEYAQHELH